jgi:hypothetical protein
MSQRALREEATDPSSSTDRAATHTRDEEIYDVRNNNDNYNNNNNNSGDNNEW